jgi:initiation factor 1A
MPKNLIGGKGFKRGKKVDYTIARKFPTKSNLEQDSNGEDLFLYAQVDAVLGGKHVSLKSLTDETLIGSIRGNMYKKVWLNKGDFVLCSKRIGLNDNKCDIIFKYNSDEVQFLKKSKEILIQEQETNNFIENQIFTQQENAEEIEEDEKIDNLSDIDIDEI